MGLSRGGLVSGGYMVCAVNEIGCGGGKEERSANRVGTTGAFRTRLGAVRYIGSDWSDGFRQLGRDLEECRPQQGRDRDQPAGGFRRRATDQAGASQAGGGDTQMDEGRD